jgi:hypothetical protein
LCCCLRNYSPGCSSTTTPHDDKAPAPGRLFIGGLTVPFRRLIPQGVYLIRAVNRLLLLVGRSSGFCDRALGLFSRRIAAGAGAATGGDCQADGPRRPREELPHLQPSISGGKGFARLCLCRS